MWGQAPEMIFEQTKKLFLFALGFTGLFAGAAQVPETQLSALKKWLPLSVCITATLILIEFNFDLPFHRFYQSLSEPSEPIDMWAVNRGQVLNAVWLWPIAWLLFKHHKKSAAIVGCALIIGSVFFAWSSQGAALAILVGGMTWATMRLYPSRFVLKAFFIFIAIIIFAMPLITEILYMYAGPWLAENLQAGAASERLFIWHITVTQIMEHPVLGYGFEATKSLSPIYIDQASGASQNYLKSVDLISHPHNFALQIWLEMGLAGILLMLFHLSCLFKYIDRMNNNIWPLVMACLTSILAIGSVNYGVWQGWWLGTIFLTVIVIKKMADLPKP